MKVLANDGISESGKNALLEAGIEFVEAKVSQEQLIEALSNLPEAIQLSVKKELLKKS